jgi:hypothetical protein
MKYIIWILFLISADLHAGVIEISGSFSYSQSNLGPTGYSWTRRFGISVGYYFFELSEIQFSMQDSIYRTVSMGEDTTFHDQIYSLEWVQSLLPKSFGFQPYVKLGAGQLNREASGTYWTGGGPPAIYDSLTVLLGAGLRVFISRSFALRAEGTTYLVGGSLSNWQDNLSLNGGASIYF